MTIDEPFLPATSYAQISIPGVPYSALRFPLGINAEEMDQWAQWAVAAAQIISSRFTEAFPPPPLRDYSPDIAVMAAASAAQQRPAPRPAARAAAPRAGSGLYCPEHTNVEAVPSKKEYARFEEDEYGNQVQANYFCPGEQNGTGKNHQLWRRQLVAPADDLPF